ncbi:CAP domain-containing protein [Emergencia sp. 1XD21-10]|uniref:CAP domain-containing protein n=1 Tax=Emergencia sp. 1XD21-10 TaxID=2304569 RepID=UPI001A9B3CDF|nr:CAP domain-containing protein [Emergencia sp. 1XD21-10]
MMKRFGTFVLTLCVVLTVIMTAGQVTYAAESEQGATMYPQAEIKAPTSVRAITSGTRTIKVSWKKVSGAEEYQIYQRNTKSNTWRRVRTTEKTAVTFTGLSQNTTYRYKIRAVDSGKVSAFSSNVSAKTGVVTRISLSRKTKSLYGNGSFVLKATVSAKAPAKTVRWSSSDCTVATVSTSGKVTARRKGIVRITAKAHNGVTTSCLVTVGTEFDKAYQKEMLRLVNDLRKKNGLNSLKYAYHLQAATDIRAYEAWAYKQMGHMRYNKYGKEAAFNSVYTDLELNLDYNGTGENLAWRSNSFNDPVAAARAYFEQWKNSPGHRANILRKGIKSMAVSYLYQSGKKFSGASAQLFLM